MKCGRCQAENDQGARFCGDCGVRLESACPSCGAAVAPGRRFCSACGASQDQTTARAGLRATAPDIYTPGYLAA